MKGGTTRWWITLDFKYTFQDAKTKPSVKGGFDGAKKSILFYHKRNVREQICKGTHRTEPRRWHLWRRGRPSARRLRPCGSRTAGHRRPTTTKKRHSKTGRAGRALPSTDSDSVGSAQASLFVPKEEYAGYLRSRLTTNKSVGQRISQTISTVYRSLAVCSKHLRSSFFK